jgi:flavin-dependent dehydrogenase
MNDIIYDCAIIGGGLAGLTLATQLANTGRTVILFEKEKYPYHKVCGEYISMESFDFLERIGIPLSKMNLPFITQLIISSPNGNTIKPKLDLGGFGISRYTLDSKLAELAIAKGVVLLQETKVNDVQFNKEIFTITTTAADTYKAKIACGAFGKKSNLNKLINSKFNEPTAHKSKNYIGVKYHIKIDLPKNNIELHNFKDGYCGISQVNDNKYCLCYLTTSKNLKDNNNDIKTMEQNVLMKNPFLKKYFTEAEFLFQKPIAISQITFSKKTAVSNHLLLMGDAAGTIAPLCGNGMSMAMHSSYQAFILIKQYLDSKLSRKELEQAYQSEWNNKFSTRIKIGKYIQYFFGGVRITNIVISAFKHLPFITSKLIKITHGNKF